MKEQSLPLISVGFCITSDSADLEKISEVLKLTPSRSRRKDEWPQASIKAGIACDSWEINTEKITSMSVDAECNKMIDILKGKEEVIQSLSTELNMRMHFEVVIHMNTNKTPVISLGDATISFLAAINADIGFDVYTYDVETNWEGKLDGFCNE